MYYELTCVCISGNTFAPIPVHADIGRKVANAYYDASDPFPNAEEFQSGLGWANWMTLVRGWRLAGRCTFVFGSLLSAFDVSTPCNGWFDDFLWFHRNCFFECGFHFSRYHRHGFPFGVV